MRPMRRRRAVQNNEVLGRKPAGAGAADTGPEALFSLVATCRPALSAAATLPPLVSRPALD
jgi:hypothetical protein